MVKLLLTTEDFVCAKTKKEVEWNKGPYVNKLVSRRKVANDDIFSRVDRRNRYVEFPVGLFVDIFRKKLKPNTTD